MRLLPSCREVTEAVAKGETGMLIRLHLWHCDMCSKYLKQMRLLAQALSKQVPADSLTSRLLQQFS